MSIQVGEKVPNVELKVMGDQGPESVQTDELLTGKKVVLLLSLELSPQVVPSLICQDLWFRLTRLKPRALTLLSAPPLMMPS
ncbi:hypothetical protein [Oceanospirillum linum]|uniref:hypothetical protein n=1 Tax=Oceanospirillum linum TaxID=966 RepID=UPI00089F35C6|nr:hypothetical protein SAMN04489856_10338 [Oleiphilus messinensis]SMP13656.1 hypothetical protein SAMN06264348_102502 [Oceanospirillum linum]